MILLDNIKYWKPYTCFSNFNFSVSPFCKIEKSASFGLNDCEGLWKYWDSLIPWFIGLNYYFKWHSPTSKHKNRHFLYIISNNKIDIYYYHHFTIDKAETVELCNLHSQLIRTIAMMQEQICLIPICSFPLIYDFSSVVNSF